MGEQTLPQDGAERKSMAATRSPTDEDKWQRWVTVRHRLDQIEQRLKMLSDFCRFAATTDLDYAMADAEMAGLREERERLQDVMVRIHEE